MTTPQQLDDTLGRIKSKGYWHVAIRPIPFKEDRIPNVLDLHALLRKLSVRIRGWEFPFINPNERPHIDMDWVGERVEFEYFLEAWRFHRSGQFIHVGAMWTDWKELSPSLRGRIPTDEPRTLTVADIVLHFTEVYELAARLAMSAAGDEQMQIEVTAAGLAGRALTNPEAIWPGGSSRYIASLDSFPWSHSVERASLVSDARRHAIDASADLMRRFGWEPPRVVLEKKQEKFQVES